MAHSAVKSKKQAAARTPAKRVRAKVGRRAPTAPSATEIDARKAVARTFFDPASAAAARAAFLKRRQPDADHAG